MRLDKFLKVSRLIKRRTVANEACDAGRVLINDRPAKASAQVKEGNGCRNNMRDEIPSYNVSVHCMEGFLVWKKRRERRTASIWNSEAGG